MVARLGKKKVKLKDLGSSNMKENQWEMGDLHLIARWIIYSYDLLNIYRKKHGFCDSCVQEILLNNSKWS